MSCIVVQEDMVSNEMSRDETSERLTVRNLLGQIDGLDDLVRSGSDGALHRSVGVGTLKYRRPDQHLIRSRRRYGQKEALDSRFLADVETFLKELDQA